MDSENLCSKFEPSPDFQNEPPPGLSIGADAVPLLDVFEDRALPAIGVRGTRASEVSGSRSGTLPTTQPSQRNKLSAVSRFAKTALMTPEERALMGEATPPVQPTANGEVKGAQPAEIAPPKPRLLRQKLLPGFLIPAAPAVQHGHQQAAEPQQLQNTPPAAGGQGAQLHTGGGGRQELPPGLSNDAQAQPGKRARDVNGASSPKGRLLKRSKPADRTALGETSQAASPPAAHLTSAAQAGPSTSTLKQHVHSVQGGPSALHEEITSFVDLVSPSSDQQAQVHAIVDSVRQTARGLWPQAFVALFGSQATGLALPGSDLDIVITGVTTDLLDPGEGFKRSQQGKLVKMLSLLLKELKHRKFIDRTQRATVISARVPIIKCSIKVNDQHSMMADISLGTANGVEALEIINQCIYSMPPLRPLTLVLKALLKEQQVNEVHSGGLSSYSLVNMVIAHLQAEGYPTGLEGTWQERKLAEPAWDLGELLWGFLMRYGKAFDYCDQAVSIRKGGITRKLPDWRIRFKPFLLTVEDPQQLGKDICKGSYRITHVRDVFAASADALFAAVEAASADVQKQGEREDWAAIQDEGQHSSFGREAANPTSILSSIVDTSRVIEDRSRQAMKMEISRRQQKKAKKQRKQAQAQAVEEPLKKQKTRKQKKREKQARNLVRKIEGFGPERAAALKDAKKRRRQRKLVNRAARKKVEQENVASLAANTC